MSADLRDHRFESMKPMDRKGFCPMENDMEISNTHNETTERAMAVLKAAIKANAFVRNPEDEDDVARAAEEIGQLDRDSYLSLRDAWKDAYLSLSETIRKTKPRRKGGNTAAVDACRSLKADARSHMLVRHAIRKIARVHAANAVSLAAH
jgi:hypothetical protein